MPRYDWTGSAAVAALGTGAVTLTLPAIATLSEVNFYISHVEPDGLRLTLVAPDATELILYHDTTSGDVWHSTPGDDFGTAATGGDTHRTRVRDDASHAFDNQGGPYSQDTPSPITGFALPGTWRPDGGTLAGLMPQGAGTWTLRVTDYPTGSSPAGNATTIHAVSIITPFLMPDVTNTDEAVAGATIRAAYVAQGIDPATIELRAFYSADDTGYTDADGVGTRPYAASVGPDGSISWQNPPRDPYYPAPTVIYVDVWGVLGDSTTDTYPELDTTAALYGTAPEYRLWHGVLPGPPPFDPPGPPPPAIVPPSSYRRARGWRFLLVNTSDMSLIGEMKNAHDRQLSVDLNKSGSASGWLPTADPLAKFVKPWKTAVVAQYDDTWYWSGPVKNRQLSFAQGRVTFNAVGWYERLMNFLIQDQQVVYTGADAGFIAADLLDRARAQDARLPITLGGVAVTQNRTITYQRNQNIGQAISDLVALESGFDWYIDPVTRAFHIVERIGRLRPECKWLFIADDVHGEANLSEVVEDEDGGTVVNWISPIGQAHQLAPQIDPDSIDELEGVFMEAPSLSDVVDDNVLLAYAAGELVYRALPRVTYTMTPKSSSKGNVPRIFREFDLGDTTYLTARRDGFSVVNQGERIFGVTLSIQDNGSELLTNLQTTAG